MTTIDQSLVYLLYLLFKPIMTLLSAYFEIVKIYSSRVRKIKGRDAVKIEPLIWKL